MPKSLLCLILIFSGISCHTKTPFHNERQIAEKFTAQGSELVAQRILLGKTDSLKAEELNSLAIQKFDSAYNVDTTYVTAQLLASECCMYGRRFQDCIYWLNKLLLRDTSKYDIADRNEMIGYCYANLGELEKGFPNFNQAIEIWQDILPSNKNLVLTNLLNIANRIFETNDANLKSKGIDPCQYSIKILKYLNSIDSNRILVVMIAERTNKCK